MANAVVYMNLDTIIKGNYSYRAYSSPIMYDFIYDVTRSIRMTSNETVFERWLKNEPNSDNTAPK